MAETGYLLTPELHQKQVLTQRQRLGLEFLQLPLIELENRLDAELVANPVLEELPPEEPPDDAPETPETPPEPFDDATLDAEAAESSDDWSDELPLPVFSESGGNAPHGSGDDFLRYTPDAPPDFRAQLEAELGASNADARTVELASAIIGALDDRGFLAVPEADLAMSRNADPTEIEAALKLVQSFDPPGVAARNPPECWLLQLRRRNEATPLFERLLTEGVEELAANRLPKLASRLGVPLEELGKALRKLRSLSPVPIPGGSAEKIEYITPDAEIYVSGDKFEARLTAERRRIAIAPHYREMLADPALPAEARQYLSTKFKNAAELLKSLALRKSTLLRLTELLIDTQEPFLRNGVPALKPLTMKQAAETLELSESTVSRAAAEKFVATPQGIFPFRFFFSSGYTSESGESVSNRAVMEKLRDLIAAEDPRHPLSDEHLAAQLKSAGFAVARRTVAKYRDILKIPGSSLRRKHV